jgi:hypothetical protein
MYDLATLYRILKEQMPYIRARLTSEEWREFSAALQELAPAFATDDPEALERATDRGYEICFRYDAVRAQFPASGAIIEPPDVEEPHEVEDLPQRMHQLLSDPQAECHSDAPGAQTDLPEPTSDEGESG